MRVLHVTSSFPRDPHDHVAPFLLDLARAQGEAGIEVSVLAPHDAGLPRSEVMDGIKVHRFRYAPDRFERLAYRGGLLGRTRRFGGLFLLSTFLIAFTAAALRLVRRTRPDVIHAHWWVPAGLCALLAARITKTPLVVTLHGTDAHLLHQPLVRRLARAVLRRAALVAVVSDDLQDQLRDLAPGVDSLVLRLPVVTEREPADLPLHPPIQLVAAGRLSPEKGFDVLLEAMHLAVAEGRDLRLDIIGSGPEQERILALAKPLRDRVRLLPAMPRAELLRRIDEAHALVAPSRREGLGMVALEALSRGRPVIASRVGGLVETVEHGVDGLLVAPDDAESLATALQELKLCRPRGAALDRHETGSVGKAHLEAYESVMGVGDKQFAR